MNEVWTAFMFLAEADQREGIPHALIPDQGICPLDHAIEQARNEGASVAGVVLLAEDETEYFNPRKTYSLLYRLKQRWLQVGFDVKIQTYSCLEGWIDHHVAVEGHWDIIHLSSTRLSSSEGQGDPQVLEYAVA